MVGPHNKANRIMKHFIMCALWVHSKGIVLITDMELYAVHIIKLCNELNCVVYDINCGAAISDFKLNSKMGDYF